MDHATSADGTRIAITCSGTGSPLVLVHGTGAAPTSAWPAFAGLERRFRTVAMERRGRGSSGDAAPDAIEREFEDVAAVVADEVIERLEALLAVGDREAVLTTHYREVAQMAPADVARLRASPAWSDRLATAPTVPREVRAFERYVFDADRFRDHRVPTVLLVGGASPPRVRRASEAVGRDLPGARVVALPGQEHVAMYAAPEVYVEAVVAALGGG